MSSRASFIFMFLFSFLTSFRASAQDHGYIYHFCGNTTSYSANSTYFTNLKILLSSLSSGNASYSTGFQNATVGQAPNRVTGLFLCRGDVSQEACSDCVSFSVKDILTKCPNQSDATIYYNRCMLRYSDRYIFSNLTLSGEFLWYNGYSIGYNYEDQFEKLVLTTMIEAALEAANSSRYFCERNAKWKEYENLYVLVQCTPDLTRQDCLFCLQKSINLLPFKSKGARLLFPSCNSRYELFEFYNETDVKTPPLAASTPPVSSAPRPNGLLNAGKGGNSSVVVIAILVAIIIAFVVSIAGYCFLAKRKKKNSDNKPDFYGDDITTIESLQLDYRTIQAATNDYSENNKIGQGGFGEVYKGTFSNGTEVAVKRLPKSSGQGETEFKNEVVVVAKLQHRNLKRLYIPMDDLVYMKST
ncbi:cysteine-rich receptor-like protein kinase 10 isoform X1 [Raphanus sativus]|uniref:Cysteine-rich receptor-like protein kinase 10 isoform X1 n=1 Tax=Raphanus sativus TaxID=3726 RepID=A0A9W3DML8_RAPSA|nr:cysteine-rich receptor-like protein kinase 10 isoform X1 [Raphanus sativus]XP_056865148.1 cysteine-rich receptor-like protein kinase 10 isoform X1 [Raphanus sativus]